jgi:anhydro-N-acetylmuramic acid kinase
MSLALGLNSGSSFDGIDAVLAVIENASDGYPGRPKFRAILRTQLGLR